MRGTKRERRPGVWELRVYLGVDPVTKKRRYRSHTYHGTVRGAERELARLVAQVEKIGPGTTATLGQLIDAWLDIHGPELSPTTATEYRRLVTKRIGPALGHIPLSKLKAEDLERFYRALVDTGLSPRSVRHAHSVIRRALQIGLRWEWVDRNPAAAVQPPKVRRARVRPPSARQIVGLLEKAETEDPELACLLRVAAALGARRGELCGLRWGDVDLGAGTVSIHRTVVVVAGRVVEKSTKTDGSERVVDVGSGTVASLAAHAVRCAERAAAAGEVIEPESFVFSPAPDGSLPIRPEYVTKGFRRIADQCGLKGVRLHDLRHANATELLAAGHDLKTVQQRLGHATASMTLDVYAHALPGGGVTAAKTMDDLLDGGTDG